MSVAQFVTFGCRLNALESDEIASFVDGVEDVVVVNTCAVTKAAEKQAHQAIRQIYRRQPNARIVVSGCAAQLDPQGWRSLPGVSDVLDNQTKTRPQSWQAIIGGSKPPKSVAKGSPSEGRGATGRTRALLQVQQGCDHRCTFCIIPYGRGPSRSFSVDEVVHRAQHLVEEGHCELVLTGVDIASWGADLPGDLRLGDLCSVLLQRVSGIRRLRLSSVDPAGMDAMLWKLLEKEERFSPHLHLSLQAASDLILKRMKRRHRVHDVANLITRARALRPDIAFGADIIAGFPTETESQADETCAFVAQHAIAYLHVFPYSERPGTPAALMPAVNVAERQRRAARLRAIGEENRMAFLRRFIGQPIEILMEGDGRGRSAHFIPVHLQNAMVKPRELVRVVPHSMGTDCLIAERI